MRALVATCIALLVGSAVLATAWICDDALVTLRNVENLAAGDGFRWNVLDRTQTATHPLWILFLAGLRLITGESYYTAIWAGIGLSTLCAWLLARHAANVAGAVVIVGIGALGSRAFVDYGTGGLENPLVYGLLALFLREWIADRDPGLRLRRLALIGALVATARQDVVLLIAPALVVAMFGLGFGAIARAVWPGALVGLLWYGFALVYFGTVIPTPGYGKVVSADVSQSALLVQGLHYFAAVATRDPVTTLVLFGAIVAGFVRPTREKTALAAGVALQCLYTLRVGGDFMLGRFFTAAFVVALFVLGRSLGGRAIWAAGGVLLIGSFAAGLPTWSRSVPEPAEARIEHGIADERAVYAQPFGLWSDQRTMQPHGASGQLFAVRERPAVVVATTAGVFGYFGGRNVHLVEPFLCDPLLMRLPLEDASNWRIGHFKRRIPAGYLETLASGTNQIHHRALAEYWDRLESVLRAPLFSAERWGVLWRFWTGDYDALLERYVDEAYRSPPLLERELASFQNTAVPGTPWFDVPCVVVREGGLRIGSAQQLSASRLRLLVDGGGRGEVIFRRAGEEVGRAPLGIGYRMGSIWSVVDVPGGVGPFDAFEIRLVADPQADPKFDTLPVFALLRVEIIP